jgi:hypothetical protein
MRRVVIGLCLLIDPGLLGQTPTQVLTRLSSLLSSIDVPSTYSADAESFAYNSSVALLSDKVLGPLSNVICPTEPMRLVSTFAEYNIALSRLRELCSRPEYGITSEVSSASTFISDDAIMQLPMDTPNALRYPAYIVHRHRNFELCYDSINRQVSAMYPPNHTTYTGDWLMNPMPGSQPSIRAWWRTYAPEVSPADGGLLITLRSSGSAQNVWMVLTGAYPAVIPRGCVMRFSDNGAVVQAVYEFTPTLMGLRPTKTIRVTSFPNGSYKCEASSVAGIESSATFKDLALRVPADVGIIDQRLQRTRYWAPKRRSEWPPEVAMLIQTDTDGVLIREGTELPMVRTMLVIAGATGIGVGIGLMRRRRLEMRVKAPSRD